jgi:hypothetical protein
MRGNQVAFASEVFGNTCVFVTAGALATTSGITCEGASVTNVMAGTLDEILTAPVLVGGRRVRFLAEVAGATPSPCFIEASGPDVVALSCVGAPMQPGQLFYEESMPSFDGRRFAYFALTGNPPTNLVVAGELEPAPTALGGDYAVLDRTAPTHLNDVTAFDAILAGSSVRLSNSRPVSRASDKLGRAAWRPSRGSASRCRA